MTTMKKLCLITKAACVLLVFACKKDKNEQVKVPELTTTAVTNITAATAISGGNITSNGGETITISGICWSTSNQNPTLSDDTTKGNTASGSFTAILTELNSSSTYYVRAYATNRIGTGYGNVVTFNTGNGAPTATSLTITGDAIVGAELTASYTYSDPESDPQSGSTFKWYVANDAAGAGEVEISGATELTYTIQDDQEEKFIRFGVTPKSSAGNTDGTEVKSAFIGAVGEATTVTFTYNGAEVTYGIITGLSGKKWLDRNLGASRLAQSADDYVAYGDLFQWGRASDGHQLITRNGINNGDAIGVNGTATTQSSSNVAGTNKFIIDVNILGDWRNPQESNLWQGVNGVNNPCPAGWRVPTLQDWENEFSNTSTIDDAFSRLKIPRTGYRFCGDGVFYGTDAAGYYVTSTVDDSQDPDFSFRVKFDATSFSNLQVNRGSAYACRCIRE